MPANSIYAALSECLSGTTLTLLPSTFAGGIAEVLGQYFPSGGVLVINGVTLVQQGDRVTFTGGIGVTAPLNGTRIDAVFAPGQDGAGQDAVVMTLTATLPSGWLFSAAWPLLANGATDQLSVTGATMIFSSIASIGSGVAKGLNFAGTIGFPTGWSAALWLLGGATTLRVSGPIGQQGTAPSFAFTAPIGSVELPVLGALSVDFVFTSVVISGAVVPPGQLGYLQAIELLPAAPDQAKEPAAQGRSLAGGEAAASTGNSGEAGPRAAAPADDGPVISPWVPQVTLGVQATLTIAGTPVPITVDLSVPSSTVPITADVSRLSLVALTDLLGVLDGTDLGAALPPRQDFDPGQFFTLQTLTFTLAPAQRRLVSAGITLGTHKAWQITSGLSCGPVTFSFLVGFSPKMVSASLTGTINFQGGSLGLGAYYPGFTFTGGLTPGSTINLSALISAVLNNTPIGPTLILDKLDFAVSPLNGGSFSLDTELTGDWSFPVGVASLALTRAYLQLDRQAGGGPGGGTSGSIGVSGALTPPQDIGAPITFDGAWNLPGSFSLTGKFPDLDLTALASSIAGVTPPAGVPDIALVNGVVAIVADLSTGDYSFALATSATVDGSPLGSALFAVRKTPTAFGFLIGFVVTAEWSPAQVWPEFADIFGRLSFANSGLLISTLPTGAPVNLPNMTMPSLPASTSPGFTFFSTLALEGAILGPLAVLFSRGVTLNLLAAVDTGTPAKSAFQAIFKGTSINNSMTWNDIVVTMKPAAASFSVRAGATFQIEDEKLTLSGQGDITLEPPSVAFTLLLTNWEHPFGIQNLVIKQFGLQIGYKDGAALTIGLLGAFVIGIQPRTFDLVIGGEIIDFEAPGALIFQLKDNDPLSPMMLSDVIMQFTELDLSSVPVLNAIGFRELLFAVVDDPAGFTIGDYTFPFGIGIAADIVIYSWAAKFNLQVSYGTGIIASGSINKPISLGGIFALSSVDGKTGPSGSIDTSRLPSRTERRELEQRRAQVAIGAAAQPYFTLDGRLQFLGIDESIKASASGKSFDFEVSWSFLHTVTAYLACHLQDATHFSAAANIGFDLDVTLGPYSVGGIELIPRVHIDGPAASLAFAVQIDPTVIAQLSLGLKFQWGSFGFDVGFTLSAADIRNELTKLWSALISWLENNVGKLFADLLADVAKWVKALETIFKDLVADIANVANALANFFKTAAEDAAAFLKRLGYDFLEIVTALVDFFKMAWDAAYRLVASLWNDGDCSMSNAQELAYDPTTADARYNMRDVAFALTGSSAGQDLLQLYYRNADELDVLLAPHPYLHDRLRGMASSSQRSRDVRLLADTALRALVAVAPAASPRLSDDIDELIPMLMRYRIMSTSSVLRELESGE